MSGMRTVLTVLVALALGTAARAEAPRGPAPAQGLDAAGALARLTEGNRRWVAGALEAHRESPERQAAIAAGQQPIAIVIACSDSRVGPEVVFDQNRGDVFAIRVAGNLATSDQVVGSAEYAVDHLHVPLVIVLGHEKCGAVAGALDARAHAVAPDSAIHRLLIELGSGLPVVEPSGPSLEVAVHRNVLRSLDELKRRSPLIAAAAARGTVRLVGGVVALRDGRVSLIETR